MNINILNYVFTRQKGNTGSWHVKLEHFYAAAIQECYDTILLDKKIIDIKNTFCLLNPTGISITDHTFTVLIKKKFLMRLEVFIQYKSACFLVIVYW